MVFQLEACRQDPCLVRCLAKPGPASPCLGALGRTPGAPGAIVRPFPKEGAVKDALRGLGRKKQRKRTCRLLASAIDTLWTATH